MPLDSGIGIAAAVALTSKFVERSTFSSRHDVIYDKELEKSSTATVRFQNVPKEDVDFFEAEEYNLLHSKSMSDLEDYRSSQDEYKEKDWHREPRAKFRLRSSVREAKRRLQSSVSRERSHVDELETYSRSAHSRSGSAPSFASHGSKSSGLDLNRSRHYRTDSVSIRAVNHSPPVSLDVSHDDFLHDHVFSEWLSSVRALTAAQQLAESYRSRSSNSGSSVAADSGVRMPLSPDGEPVTQASNDKTRLGDGVGSPKLHKGRKRGESPPLPPLPTPPGQNKTTGKRYNHARGATGRIGSGLSRLIRGHLQHRLFSFEPPVPTPTSESGNPGTGYRHLEKEEDRKKTERGYERVQLENAKEKERQKEMKNNMDLHLLHPHSS